MATLLTFQATSRIIQDIENHKNKLRSFHSLCQAGITMQMQTQCADKSAGSRDVVLRRMLRILWTESFRGWTLIVRNTPQAAAEIL